MSRSRNAIHVLPATHDWAFSKLADARHLNRPTRQPRYGEFSAALAQRRLLSRIFLARYARIVRFARRHVIGPAIWMSPAIILATFESVTVTEPEHMRITRAREAIAIGAASEPASASATTPASPTIRIVVRLP